MRFSEIISEAVRPAILFHATGPDEAVKILYSNVLLANTDHDSSSVGASPSKINKYDRVNGVSLTRDIRFARAWGSGQGVVFALDEAKLRQRHQMYQIDYYKDRREAEEFVIGPIQNLSNYLIAIMFSQETAEDMMEEDDRYDEDQYKLYKSLLDHPQTKIMGAKWDGMTGTILN